MADKIRIRDFGLHIENSLDLPQLRMQALNTACDFELFSEEEGKATLSNAMKVADQIVHYCLTGEHQLPEEKE